MDTSTNRLISAERMKALQDLGTTFGLDAGSNFEPVPDELEHAARAALAGRDEVTVSRTSGGKLSKWAASRRKAKRKMARESRRKNR